MTVQFTKDQCAFIAAVIGCSEVVIEGDRMKMIVRVRSESGYVWEFCRVSFSSDAIDVVEMMERGFRIPTEGVIVVPWWEMPDPEFNWDQAETVAQFVWGDYIRQDEKGWAFVRKTSEPEMKDSWTVEMVPGEAVVRVWSRFVEADDEASESCQAIREYYCEGVDEEE